MQRFVATGEDILMANRMKPLVFGYYAWGETEEKHRVWEAGSGVIVAPGLGLSAKHVSKGFQKLDPQFDAIERRRSPLDAQYQTIRVRTEYATLVYQMPLGEEYVRWLPVVDWGSHDTDIDSIVLVPETDAAKRVAPTLRYFPWQLLPPPIGSLVRVYGWPDQHIEIDGTNHELTLELHAQRARVTETIYPMLAHGFGEFPAFRLHQEYAHGFSGGPVLYNGKLVGIFSGPDLVACLWPLALHTYEDTTGHVFSFEAHFDSKLVDAVDWDEVKGRVRRAPCDEALAGTRVESRCTKQHVVIDQRR